MSQLWRKGDGDGLHPHLERVTVGRDLELDRELLPYDVRASQAHTRMLGQVGILSADEVGKLVAALEDLMPLVLARTFEIRVDQEDGHTALEEALIESCGDTGKKIHTGRSRNDQVLVALRLYMKDHLRQLGNLLWVLGERLSTAARKWEAMPLPGYTHTQQAMLSSVGHWLAAHLESVCDDMDLAIGVGAHLDTNPLGSAAGYGVGIELDRQATTEELGFNDVQLNSLYCQNSRGKFESLYLEALNQVMMTLSRFAADVVLFTSKEFGFFTLDNSLVTGSSIMPQKRNCDGLELLRASAPVVAGYQQTVRSISSGLISGYHRDTQLMKGPLIDSTRIVMDAVVTTLLYLDGLKPNEDVIRARLDKGLFAADIANNLVQDQGIAFRDAYREAMSHLESTEIDVDANLRSKVSLGAPGNLQLEFYEARLAARAEEDAEADGMEPLLPDPFNLESLVCPTCKAKGADEAWWVSWTRPIVTCSACKTVSECTTEGQLSWVLSQS